MNNPALLAIVDDRGVEIATIEKMEAHRVGSLHRAFSVFVFDRAGRLLLQQRAATKYHSGGLWSNTCCGHPAPGEDAQQAASRRLREEMGFDCPLIPLGAFVYQGPVGNGLVEHEYDHVFVGYSEDAPDPDPREVGAWQWIALATLREDLQMRPGLYTLWLPMALELVTTSLLRP